MEGHGVGSQANQPGELPRVSGRVAQGGEHLPPARIGHSFENVIECVVHTGALEDCNNSTDVYRLMRSPAVSRSVAEGAGAEYNVPADVMHREEHAWQMRMDAESSGRP